MRLYICGPMSGIPEDNFPAFMEAEERLTTAGYVVINPARGSTPIANGRYGHDWWQSPEYQAVVERGVAMMEPADGLALLPGWRKSNGADNEVFRAKIRGLPCQTVDYWVRDGVPGCIQWTGDPECCPKRGYAGDAGFDLVVAEDTRLHVGSFQDVDMGVRVELPPGVWGLLVGRSSTIRRRSVLVVQGVIDNGYRGPLFAACQNLGRSVVELRRGERIAQLIPFPLVAPRLGLKRVDELEPSDRGERGFGSTGS